MKALDEIAHERRRQISSEGWSPAHDDEHAKGEMASAAACYALPQDQRWNLDARDYRKIIEHIWPWNARWWKPGDRRRELVKAGALIVAELERLDRIAARALAAKQEPQKWNPELGHLHGFKPGDRVTVTSDALPGGPGTLKDIDASGYCNMGKVLYDSGEAEWVRFSQFRHQ